MNSGGVVKRRIASCCSGYLPRTRVYSYVEVAELSRNSSTSIYWYHVEGESGLMLFVEEEATERVRRPRARLFCAFIVARLQHSAMSIARGHCCCPAAFAIRLSVSAGMNRQRVHSYETGAPLLCGAGRGGMPARGVEQVVKCMQ